MNLKFNLSPIAFLFVLSWGLPSSAYQIDFSAFYFSDSLDSGTETTNSRIMLDGSVGMPLSKKSSIVLSWAVTKLSYSLDGTSSAEISTLEHGPKIGWYIDKNQLWSIFVTYHLFTNATFTDGSEDLDWRGNSYKIDFGITPQITANFLLGIRLNYYSASYDEQFDSSSTFSEIETSQSMIYPSLAMTYIF